MSYCRCSTPGSNVYVFGTGDGWEIHVQGSEQIDKTLKFDLTSDNWRPFPHELRGKGYYCKTQFQCVKKLLELRAAGIKVPRCALIRLRREIRDNA